MSESPNIWKTPDHTPKRDLDIDQAAAVEDALDVAAAWARDELPTGEALRLVLATPRTLGLAFQHRWTDERRPALERLHMLEYGAQNHMTYTNFGWLPNAEYDRVQRDLAYRRQWADDRAA